MTEAKREFDEKYVTTDFEVEIGGKNLAVRLLSPVPEALHADPLLLLHFAGSKEFTLYEESYPGTNRLFLEQGHRVLSFDIPSHGARIDGYGEGITGFCNAFMAGHDPFAAFAREGSAVIDYCLSQHLVNEGHIVACGTSRAGYLSLRLAAADARVGAVAAVAPVTDWRALSEFAAVKNESSVASLHLSNYAEALAGRSVFSVIGNHDERVSTLECCRFYCDLVTANGRQGYDDSRLNFQVLDVPGHYSPEEWHLNAGRYLLRISG